MLIITRRSMNLVIFIPGVLGICLIIAYAIYEYGPDLWDEICGVPKGYWLIAGIAIAIVIVVLGWAMVPFPFSPF